MGRLDEAIETLGIKARARPAGPWVELEGERCTVFVMASAGGGGYYSWCDDPGEQEVEFYLDPVEAIRAGLRRAARPARTGEDKRPPPP